MGITAINKAQANVGIGVDENNFGMTLISANKKLPVESLKFNRQYQRATQPARKENVKQSIIKCGHFLPDQSITVNQDYEVVDGQHRLLAARDLKISHIPATIYNFSDKEKEAAFFVHINGFDQRLSQIDYWYGRFLSGCPLAKFMYFLEDDPASFLCKKIVVKGADTNHKLTTADTLMFILLGLEWHRDTWEAKNDWAVLIKLKTVGDKATLGKINLFAKWFEGIFGDKKTNPCAYRRDSLRAIISTYKKLHTRDMAHSRSTIQKLKTFHMGTTFLTAPLSGKIFQITDHFNKGRQKNKIPYNMEKE